MPKSNEILKCFCILGLLAMLISCSKTDYSKPHEYINAVGYGENWTEVKENNYTLHLADIYGKFIVNPGKNHFELGSSKCEQYLKALDAEWVYQLMAATNYAIHSNFEGRHDTPIKYAKLQCIAYLGQNQVCEAKRIDLLKKIYANGSREDAKALLLITMASCDTKKEVGSMRTFSLDDSKKYGYVP